MSLRQLLSFKCWLPLPCSPCLAPLARRHPPCGAGSNYATRQAAHCCRSAAILSFCCGQLCRLSFLLPAVEVGGIGVGAEAQLLHQLACRLRCGAGEGRGNMVRRCFKTQRVPRPSTCCSIPGACRKAADQGQLPVLLCAITSASPHRSSQPAPTALAALQRLRGVGAQADLHIL